MGNEKSSADIMRSLGAIPDQTIQPTPDAMQTISDSSRQMFEEHKKPWDEQSDNISASVRNASEIKNLVDDEARERETEYFQNLDMEEDRGKMDFDMTRLSKAEDANDVAALLPLIEESKDWDLAEAHDRYGSARIWSFALKRSKVMAMTHNDLVGPRDRIVISKTDRKKGGKIQSDGWMDPNSEVRIPGAAIRVETSIVEKDVVVGRKESHVKNSEGARTGDVQVIEDIRTIQERKEKVYFGTEKERRILKKSLKALVWQAVTSEKLHNQVGLQWNLRAALEGLVKTVYTKEIINSNKQISEWANAPDIRKMDQKEDNTEVGDRRDKGMRLLELVGHCETKEKLEKHLNGTFNLEMIFDQQTQTRVLGLMKELGVVDKDEMKKLKQLKVDPAAKDVDERYKKVVEFLIGENITITKDVPNGALKYTLGAGWLTADQRDPSKGGKGKKAIGDEKDVRGWLTKNGNPYVRDRDGMNNLLAKMNLVVGDPDAMLEADRRFYWWGEKDWLGLEVYAPSAVCSGEELLKQRNTKIGKEWLDWAEEQKSYFATGGEPVGTDLIKLFHTDWYRLKDLLAYHGRPSGSYLTVGKVPHLAQALMGLGRSTVVINGIEKTRSLREQWVGSKDEVLGNEKPHKLGEINWEATNTTPPEVLEAMVDERVGEINWDELKAKVPEKLRTTVDSFKNGDRKAIEKMLSVDSGGVMAGIEGFYWLLNFLNGDEKETKRWWQILTVPLDPRSLITPEGFTAKVKFGDINQRAVGSYDDFKEVEKRALVAVLPNGQVGRLLPNGQADIDGQTNAESEIRVSNLFTDWYASVRADPSYPMFSTQQYPYLVEYYDEKGVYQSKAGSKTWNDIVEGYVTDNVTKTKVPGLAQIYGFLSMDEIDKPPLNRFELIRTSKK